MADTHRHVSIDGYRAHVGPQDACAIRTLLALRQRTFTPGSPRGWQSQACLLTGDLVRYCPRGRIVVVAGNRRRCILVASQLLASAGPRVMLSEKQWTMDIVVNGSLLSGQPIGSSTTISLDDHRGPGRW